MQDGKQKTSFLIHSYFSKCEIVGYTLCFLAKRGRAEKTSKRLVIKGKPPSILAAYWCQEECGMAIPH